MTLRRVWLPAIAGVLLPLVFVSTVSAAAKHTVSPGETLSFIALIYETSVDELASGNGIFNPDFIYPGQELDVPGDGEPAAANNAAGSYVVQAGDTLSGIAYSHDITTDALASANGIGDFDFIAEGQVLSIPGSSAPSVVAEVPKLQFPERPVDADTEAIIEEIAADEGVPAGLVKAIATVESGWSQWALSHAGAIGVMQVMPGTVAWLENDVFGYDFNEYDSVYDNVRLGTRYLRILMDSTDGDYYDTAASYYQGLSPTEAGVYYPDTADYASMVLSVMNAYWP